MKKHISILIVGLLILSGLIWLLGFRGMHPLLLSPSGTAVTQSASIQGQAISTSAPNTNATINEAASPLKGKTDAERWAWYLQHVKAKDMYFQYRMPIDFYGKVIDDDDNPVGGTNVAIVLTSENGTPQEDLQTDANGNFSVTGKTGKNLYITVSKKGYKQEDSKNRRMFDYADFMKSDFFEPDPHNPVVFYLRKDTPAEPLVVREGQEVQLQPGQKATFLIGASRNENTSPQIVVELLTNGPAHDKIWSARVSVPGGGLILYTDEFPDEAPEDGYVPSFDLQYDNPQPKAWPGGSGGAFFVKTPQGYGRIIVSSIPGKPWVYVTSYFNPSGSRNLTFDPKQRIRSTQ